MVKRFFAAARRTPRLMLCRRRTVATRLSPNLRVASACAGDLAYISGHGPFDGDRQLFSGRVGAELSVEQAYDAARATGLSMLSSLKRELGDLGRVKAWIKVLGFVKCAEGFNITPAAINGFSDLILTLWGEAGRHARLAIGADELPMGVRLVSSPGNQFPVGPTRVSRNMSRGQQI